MSDILQKKEPSDVKVTRGICYGRGVINFNGKSAESEDRPLLMDLYQPVGARDGLRPALILAFGGAFHRGSKEDDSYEDNGWRNTPIAEYCRIFASRGIICASVGYRLTSEDPGPGPRRVITEPEAVSRSRIDHVRGLLGLEPATNKMLVDGMEAAFADVAAAFRYVHANAGDFGIDPTRIGIGGFSAGGTSALYSVFAYEVPAAALLIFSGRMEEADIARYITPKHRIPVLHVVGENDLAYVRLLTGKLAECYRRVGIEHSVFEVPEAGHFYPRTAEVVCPEGQKATVESSALEFLEQHLGNCDAKC